MSDPHGSLRKSKGNLMKLTKRGQRVATVALLSFMVGSLALAGKFDALDQCAEFQANNDYQSAIDAGCSFDMLPNGEYPYTWEVK
jgi:hypothetical protein